MEPKDMENSSEPVNAEPEQNTEAESLKNAHDLFTHKTTKIIAIVIASVILIAAAYFGIRAYKYRTAVSAFQNGEYQKAEEIFSSLGTYKESEAYKERSALGVHYTNATSMFLAGEYEDAIEEYKKASDFEDAKENVVKVCLALADEQFKQKQYTKAAKSYQKANNSEGVMNCGIKLAEAMDIPNALAILEKCQAADANLYYNYVKGLECMESEAYKDAVSFFEAAEGVLEADEYKDESVFLYAESCLASGYLNKAKALYESLPEEYTNNDISASERIALLDKNKAFLKLVGEWPATSNYYKVRANSTTSSYYYYWYMDGTKKGSVTVVCPYNGDGTFTITGKATFPSYQNFSQYSSNLKTDMESYSFHVSGKTVPYNIGSSKTTKLSYNSKGFSLKYKYTDEYSNIYWNYVYTSNSEFAKRVMLAEDS